MQEQTVNATGSSILGLAYLVDIGPREAGHPSTRMTVMFSVQPRGIIKCIISLRYANFVEGRCTGNLLGTEMSYLGLT